MKVFGICGRDLRTGYAAAKRYRDMSMQAITSPKARELAEKRVQETDELLRRFEEETFGLY